MATLNINMRKLYALSAGNHGNRLHEEHKRLHLSEVNRALAVTGDSGTDNKAKLKLIAHLHPALRFFKEIKH